MLSNPEEDDASEAAQNKRAKFEIPKIPRQSDIQPMDIDEKVSQIYRFIMRKIYWFKKNLFFSEFLDFKYRNDK